MSTRATSLVGPEEVLSIAEDVWSSLVGPEEVVLPLPDPPAHLPLDAVSAWVLLVGPWSGSFLVACAPDTARELTRALLRAGDDEELDAADVADALGELANVVGGGVKSLLPAPSFLGLPQTGPAIEAPTGAVVVQLDLSWRGRPLCLGLRSAAVAARPPVTPWNPPPHPPHPHPEEPT